MTFDSLREQVRTILFNGDFNNKQRSIGPKTKNQHVLGLVDMLDPNKNPSIKEILPTTRSVKESIALLRYDYRAIDYPKCETCGKTISKFANPSGPEGRPYKRFCSNKCASNNEEVKVKNAKAVSKSLKTAYDRDGEKIKKKRAKTLQNRYGSQNSSGSPFEIKEIQEKAVEAIQERYGVPNVFMLDAVKELAQDSLLKKYQELQSSRGFNVEYNVEDETITVRNGCDIHGDIVLTGRQFNNRTKEDRIETRKLCPICSPDVDRSSSQEDLIYSLIQEIDPSLEVIRNTRQLIGPKELDILIPFKKIAIEVNGLFWHCSKFKNRLYHQNKRKSVESKGYQLITLWEDMIVDSPEKIKSLLRAKLGYNDRVYARKCEVRELDFKMAKEFANLYHLQGHSNATLYLGLYFEDELVQMMSFGAPRFKRSEDDKQNTLELIRLCSKTGISVVGGPSKLLQYAIHNHVSPHILYIDSYCHLDISNGKVYDNLGFEFVSEGPSLYFVDLSKPKSEIRREPRYKYIGKEQDGLYKIHDSGVRTYRLRL